MRAVKTRHRKKELMTEQKYNSIKASKAMGFLRSHIKENFNISETTYAYIMRTENFAEYKSTRKREAQASMAKKAAAQSVAKETTTESTSSTDLDGLRELINKRFDIIEEKQATIYKETDQRFINLVQQINGVRAYLASAFLRSIKSMVKPEDTIVEEESEKEEAKRGFFFKSRS